MESAKFTPDYISGYMTAMDDLLRSLSALPAERYDGRDVKTLIYRWALHKKVS